MFDFIKKAQYFSWVQQFIDLRSTYASASIHNLKDIQDHYILSKLAPCAGMRVLEIGGGDCRVLRYFSDSNECWNAEKFEGVGSGPKKKIEVPGIKIAPTYLGEFSDLLPNDYFDVVFSISVVEHVPDDACADFFNDISRILKPGGHTFHAIDAYLFDESDHDSTFAQYTKRRLRTYLNVPEITGGRLTFSIPPVTNESPRFSCAYATNSDREMLAWNRVVPSLASVRSCAQSASVIAEWIKT